MSVIAWDGRTLAADRRITMSCGSIVCASKIFKSANFLAGFVGNPDAGLERIEWLQDHLLKESFDTYPVAGRFWDADNAATVILVRKDKHIRIFNGSPYTSRLPPQKLAIGSGGQYAQAAMYLGKSAAEAVEVAIALDSSCGNGIESLSF